MTDNRRGEKASGFQREEPEEESWKSRGGVEWELNGLSVLRWCVI